MSLHTGIGDARYGDNSAQLSSPVCGVHRVRRAPAQPVARAGRHLDPECDQPREHGGHEGIYLGGYWIYLPRYCEYDYLFREIEGISIAGHKNGVE